MNVLYLHTHDMGRFNSLYGYGARTPHFDSVARSGLLFRNAFCAGPTCSPSRAALLTGQAPHSAGMFGLANMGFAIPRPAEHLSQYLRDHGFATALFGVQHEMPDAGDLSYDMVFAPEGGSFAQRDQAAVRAAADYLLTASPDRPFFLSMGLLYPHRPFETELGDVEPDRLALPSGLPDTPQTRLDFAQYIASVEAADRCAGVVLDALEASGRTQDTIILLTTDHGIAFPEMKCNLYDGGIGVTMAMRVPGYPGGKVTDALASHIDIYPTLCELLKLPAPAWLQGRSLVPVLQDPAARVNPWIFSEVNYHVSYEPQRCVRTERFKYIRRYYDPKLLIRPNVDASLSKELRLETLGRKTRAAWEELYDLMLDPTEHYNCIADPDYGDILQEMRDRLEMWMQETDDPLLHGDIPLPENAITISPECYSASGD